MRFVTKDDFDFTRAGAYRIVEPLEKSLVRIADKHELIVSQHSAGIETTNDAKPGDYIISSAYHAGSYVMTAQRFADLYEDNPDNQSSYRSKTVRLALLVLDNVRFQAPWGELQSVIAGGMVIDSGDHIYGIDKMSFIRKYGRVDEQIDGQHVFVRLNTTLDTQYAEAKKRNHINHLQDITLRRQNQKLFLD